MPNTQGGPARSDPKLLTLSSVPTLEEAFTAFERDVAAGRPALLQRVDTPGHRMLVIAGSLVVDCFDNVTLKLRQRPADDSFFGEDAVPAAWPSVEKWPYIKKPGATGTWRVVEAWPMRSLRARIVAQRLHEAVIMLFDAWCRCRLPNEQTYPGAYEAGFDISERIWYQPGVAEQFQSALLDVFPAGFIEEHRLTAEPWYRLLNPMDVFRLWNLRIDHK